MTLWHTPRATDVGRGERSETFVARMGDRGDHCYQSLPSQVEGMVKPWPTPDAGAFGTHSGPARERARRAELKKKGINGNGAGDTLGLVSQEFAPGVTAPDPSRFPVAPSAPGRVQRLKALGNAILPEAAYWIFRAIADAEAQRHEEAA